MKNTLLSFVVLFFATVSLQAEASFLPDSLSRIESQTTIKSDVSAKSSYSEQRSKPVVLNQPSEEDLKKNGFSGTIDSIVTVTQTKIQSYIDTLVTVYATPDSTARQVEDIAYADSTDRRGHYVQAYVGGGYGTLGYKLTDNGLVTGMFSGLLQIQYAYYFHKNWGVTAGLWFTNYTSFADPKGDRLWNDVEDSDREQHYNHTSHILKWHERETIHNLGIPIGIQWNQYFNGEIGMYAGLGVAPSFSVSKRYNVRQGRVSHEGDYPNWNLNLKDMHEFREYDYSKREEAKGKLEVAPVQIGLFADLGVQIYMTKQIDFVVGAYANFIVNNTNKSQAVDLGWKNGDYAQYEPQRTDFPFMEEYRGMYATKEAGKSHPWEAGLKVGIHWHWFAKPIHSFHTEYDMFTRFDTTQTAVERLDTIVTYRYDTIVGIDYASMFRKVPVSLEPFNLIFFDLDKANINDEANEYLHAIVELLADRPDQRIAVSGHASKEGNYEHNVKLARRRAQNVVNHLIALGIDKDRIELRSYGPDVPYDNDPNHDLSLDRRVEITPID